MGGGSCFLLLYLILGGIISIHRARAVGRSRALEYVDNNDRYREFSVAKGEKGLFPSIFNLATHAEIRATSTCGQQGPEYYCKLVEHVFLRQPQCDICDANNHLKNHPIDYAIDGTRKWWQSPSLSNGLTFERINITIDLRQEYQVAYVIVKAANSPRPGSWVLEKSLDGVDFTPWQYYATSDSECMRAFGVPATVGVPKFERDDEVICTSYFSKLNPLENGEIHTSLVNGRPGSNHTSQELQDFTRARFVRLRLVGLRTLYADLMVINRRDGKLDQSVTRRYFYSLSDISIGGQCICYGHAESCPPEEVHGQFRCECRHNTCGESCTECCPLFNQLPWKPGTHDHPNICQACQCFNHAASCVYDEEVERQKASVTPEGIFEGGGRCVECQHNTGGINCEKCLPEYYRPANFSHYRPDACRPCDCDLVGAESNNCIRDETEVRDGLKPGDCICKAGFGGRRCDRCALGFRNHPVCDPCPCNQAGSLNFDTCEEDHCSCKQNVEGEFCDRCKPGTIYLDKDNPLGCQLCFCFGKSTDCREQSWTTGYREGFQRTAGTGWNLSDLHTQLEVPPSVEAETTGNGLLIFNSDDYRREQSHSIHYWKAPSALLNDGHLLNSYGSNIHYFVYFVPRDGGALGHPTPVADLIIEGNGARLEYYSRLSFFPRENISVVIPLRPAENWYDARTRRPVGKMELMRVLADTENIFVRAKYYQDQVQSSIYGLRIEQAVENGGNGAASVGENFKVRHPVEICTCPDHFEGQSCERCEVGYRRVGSQLYDGLCRKCECQEHSQLCNPHTGHCLECQHNTTGPRCEHCVAGHYGNPSLGGKLGACKPCACPTVENSHSAHCALSQLVFEGAAAVNQDEYVCTHCENGYEGNKCEVCADGYFGDAYSLEKEEGCRPCECNGNIDSMAIGNCDRRSGECLRCIVHTTGFTCEKCEENHWGSALLHTCQPCGCHHRGSQSLQCNNETGTCECNEGYTGKRCDRCEIGHGDVEAGCPECQCDPVGSLGFSCDEVSGQCPCKNGVYGKHCDRCVASYYNFTEYGCQFCHCNEYGAIAGKECNNVTGECQCLPNVEGLKCEACAEGFFNISSGAGCQACGCDEVGALGDGCHPLSGQCHCKRGVAGLKCDKCEPNHYGLDEEGCKPPGQVCDPITGDCVCPPNTQGEVCERCTSNAWNYHPYRGCELCDCDGVGADSSECDSRNGHCKCKSGYVGQKCDQCEAGFYNFPDCQPCQCNVSGTDPSQCRGSTCLCSNKGQCKCKKLTTGLKCDECASNSFSLEEHNPTGCIECFCFNRGIINSETNSSCTQSTHVWRQIYASDRKVGFEEPFEYYTRRHNIHVLREQPLNYNSYPTNHTPLYWPLPPSFLGDRTSSYNGFIRFHIRNDDNYRVLLVGNHRIELEHIPSRVARDGKYKIRLHEWSWRNRLATQIPLSRKQMMIALQNVQAIYVRATYNDMYRGDTVSISELSLDVASPPQDTETTAATGGEGSLATGIEQCSACHEGYEGLSCQNPLMGRYCRKRHLDFLNHPDDIALVGWSAPCACNGHSNECDPESCRCTNCDHHTMGDFCEQCKHGFYGNAADGHPDACRKCACPLADNSFSDTCRISPESSKGYICDACKPGYTGHYCESCIPGYYGDPSQPGGYCAMCACHTFGSVHGVCDRITGQCECRDGVGGRDCSNCRARHAFIGGVCTSCDGGCHKELMQLEDGMERTLGGLQNLTDIKPVPRKRLNRLVEAVESLGEILDGVKSSENYASKLLHDVVAGEGAVAENHYGKQAKLIEQEFNLLAERSNESVARLEKLDADLDSLRTQVHNRNRQAVDILNQMARFIHRSAATEDPNQIHYLITQAEQLLNATRQQGQTVEKQLNYARKNAEDAERLLKQVLSRKLNDTSYAYWLDKLQQEQGAIREYRDAIWDKAKGDTDAAKSINQLASQKLEQLEKTISSINTIDKEYRESLKEAESKIADVRKKAEEIERIYAEIRDSQLATLADQKDGLGEAEKSIEGSLSNPQIRDAERHAQALENEAQGLKRHSLTDAYSMDTVSASNAYRDIAFALRNASSAAIAAKDNAAEAFSAVDPASGGSLVNLAQQSLERSNNLQQRLDTALAKVSVNEQGADLRKKLNQVDGLREEIASNKEWIRGVQEELDGHHDRINNVASLVDEAEKNVASIEETAQDFSRAVDKLAKRADSVAGFNQQAVVDAIKNVTQGTDDVNDMQRVLEIVRERADSHEAEIRSVQKQLDVLKEKINEARERASKVKIGVKSEIGSTCVREYTSPLSPSPSNTISLKYRPAMDSPDSLIFFTATKGTRVQGREYIAVELRSKKIHVKWDVGGGQREAAIIKRNLLYIPNSDGFSWYHIEVKRIANSMRVSVVQKQVRGESERNVDEPTEVTVGEPDVGGDLIFNTAPGETTVSLGMQDAQMAEELGLATNRFYGTMGEIKLDGNTIPLWVFAATHGNCDGHLAPRQRSTTGHMFRDGFAQVRMPMNERPNKLVTVVYSSYSPSGLIYFRGSQATGDFLAVQLDEGALEVLMKVGEHPLARVRSTLNTYADGKSHRLRVARNNSELHLQIDPALSDHTSTVTSANATALNVPEQDHFIGGVPPNFNKTVFAAFDIRFSGFFGCIQQVRPNQLSELDIDNPTRSQRVEPGCSYKEERLSIGDRVVSFPTPGSLQSAGFQLTAHDSFSFTLATRSRSALLLHLFTESAGSLTFYITDGRVACELATANEKSEPLISSKHYSDGLSHSVFLSRDGDVIQMRLDDREVVRGTLGDEDVVGLEDALSNTLLLGGIPEKYSSLGGTLPNSDPLIGCLSDFQHNYERFALSLQAHQATIGSCEIPRYRDEGGGESGAAQQSFDRKKSRQSFDDPTLSLRSLSDESYGNDGHRRLVPFASTLSRSAKRRDSCSAPDGEQRVANSTSEIGVQFGVSESSHARVNYPDRENAPSYTSFTLDFQLRTTQRNGLLWVWASYKHYNRYFILFLEKGFPTLEIQGHKEPKLLQYRIRRVNDNRWHRIQLRKDGRVVELQVDQFGVERFREAPNPKVMRKRMYVGGVSSKHRKKFSDVIRLPGFVGCMRSFKVDGEEQSLATTSKDLIPCAAPKSNVAYIHDGGFATFGPLQAHEIRPAGEEPTIEFSLRFRPTHHTASANASVDGATKGGGKLLIALLSTNGHAYRTARFTVRIQNSAKFLVSALSPKHRVDYEWQFPPSSPLAISGAEQSRASASAAVYVCPEQWHRFELKLSIKSLKLRLDGGSWAEYPVAFPQSALHELRTLPIHLGGLPASASAALGTESMQGCVRDLEFEGRPILVDKAKKLHRAMANGCPY